MNTLLHFADAAIQYYRGKQTGLWGLVGIALAVVIAASWEYIQPIFEFLGIVTLLDKMGLIAEGSPGLTAYRIFVGFIGLYICLIIAGLALLAIFSVIMVVSQSKVGKGLFVAAFFLIFFPFVALYGVARLLVFMSDKKEQKQDPEAFAERKRLEKNKQVIDYLITAGIAEEKVKILHEREKEIDKLSERFAFDEIEKIRNQPLDIKEDNIISFEEAKNRLNRLPTMGDYFFLLGVTYDRDIYLLLPRPILPYHQNDKFVGEKWLLKGDINYQSQDREFYIDLKNSTFDREFDFPRINKMNLYSPSRHKLKEIPCEEFEMFIDPSRSILVPQLKGYLTYAHFKNYVENEQNVYFYQKRNLKNYINKAETKEEFDKWVKEISRYNVGNEDIVALIWEQNTKNAETVRG